MSKIKIKVGLTTPKNIPWKFDFRKQNSKFPRNTRLLLPIVSDMDLDMNQILRLYFASSIKPNLKLFLSHHDII